MAESRGSDKTSAVNSSGAVSGAESPLPLEPAELQEHKTSRGGSGSHAVDDRSVIIAGCKTKALQHLQNTLQFSVICFPTQCQAFFGLYLFSSQRKKQLKPQIRSKDTTAGSHTQLIFLLPYIRCCSADRYWYEWKNIFGTDLQATVTWINPKCWETVSPFVKALGKQRAAKSREQSSSAPSPFLLQSLLVLLAQLYPKTHFIFWGLSCTAFWRQFYHRL